MALGALAVGATLTLACAPPDQAIEARDWKFYGSDQANSKYSSLDRIDAGNAGDLRVAWRWRSPDQEILAAHPELRAWVHESTPLAIRGVLYTATLLSQIAALDAGTGETLWLHDPGAWKRGSPPNMGFVHRGVAYWHEAGVVPARIFAGTGDGFLIALEAATGEPVPGFGDGGRVDLTGGLRRPVDRDLYSVTSPPIVCRGVVIVGSSISDDPLRAESPRRSASATLMPPGDVRGFDAATGEVRWIFETIPEDGPAHQPAPGPSDDRAVDRRRPAAGGAGCARFASRRAHSRAPLRGGDAGATWYALPASGCRPLAGMVGQAPPYTSTLSPYRIEGVDIGHQAPRNQDLE